MIARTPEYNLEEIVGDLLVVLSEKERSVITGRFSLDNKPRKTLETIGRSFSVTRERIRQIEANALKKLQRNVHNSRIRQVGAAIEEVLAEHHGLCLEKKIITEILAKLHGPKTPLNGHIIRLALTISSAIQRSESPKNFHRFWYDEQVIDMEKISAIAKASHKILRKSGDVISTPVLVEKTAKALEMKADDFETILSVLPVDARLRLTENEKWGLQEWRHINPKSIHDKALIVMRQKKEPMHFIEITNAISEYGFDKRSVTVQAVHNDLIRYSDFVLVGRGMYALTEWGFQPGTVADVIAAILKKEGPLSKKEILEKVQKQRNVKVGTISLNLQKEAAFERVGRAVYDFNPKAWNPTKNGRGRGKTEKK